MKLRSGLTLLFIVALTHAAPRSPAIVQVYEHEQVEEEPRSIAVDDWPQEDDIFGMEEEEDDDDDYDTLNPDSFYDSNPVIGSIDLNFNVNKDNIPLLANDDITNVIFKDLEQRIAEDVKRMQEDFLLFQRLFGQRHTSAHRPSWFLPWSIPDYTPEDRPSLIPDYPNHHQDNGHTNYDYNPFLPNNDNGDGSLFGGFPFLGIDRPLFPGLPSVPGIGFANPDDLPDNYSNKTHEIHSVNGTKVVVNNTIHKESGDNGNTFFHHQVIHVKPEGEGKVPEEDTESATEVPVIEIPEEPVSEIPQESEEDSDDEINNVLPDVDNESSSGNFNPEAIPEVIVDIFPEVDVSQPEDPVADDEEFESNNLVWQRTGKEGRARSVDESNHIIFPEDDPNTRTMLWQRTGKEGRARSLEESNHIIFPEDDPNTRTMVWQQEGKGVAARSLEEFKPIIFPVDVPNAPTMVFPGPKSAAYISNRVDSEEDFEKVEIDEGEKRAPDLSKDTRVNRVHANKQGMTQVDPDAEIFNYGLVLKEAQPRDDDK